MTNRLVTLTHCRVCNSKKLLAILSLGQIRLSEYRKDNRKPAAYPLTLVLCQQCLLLQLKHAAPQSVLYTDNYGYRSGINQTMAAELKEIVQKSLLSYGKKKKGMIVVDIGANDGTLIKQYPPSLYRVAVEPIKKLAKMAKAHANIVINDFFNVNTFTKAMGKKKADIVTVISCFYDMPDPNAFVADLKEITDEEGIIVIQQNYLKSMLSLNAFDNIVHEHLEYYSMHSMTNLLARHGLEIFHVEQTPINGGSFRTYIARLGQRKRTPSVSALMRQEKTLKLHTKAPYLAFAKRVQENKSKLRAVIQKAERHGEKVYVYGASTRGNTLLQYFGLTNKLLTAAVERNEEKWGTKIASLGIPIISEEQARKEKPAYMLVLPWFFKDEFVKRERAYLKGGGKLIFPLPKMKIV